MTPSSLRSWWRSLRRSQPRSVNPVVPTWASDSHLDPTEATKQIDCIPSQPPSGDAVIPPRASDYHLDHTEATNQVDHIPSEPPSGNTVVPTRVPDYRLDPTKAKKQIDRIPRFRILVMGRANAGKTTLLQRVCATTDQPEIFNGKGEKVDVGVVQGSLMRGYHNIEDELVFKSNPRFVFHDSCGFEAGSEAEFDEMKKFVTDQAKSTKLERRIHAIWYCIPLNESHRMVMAAERKFFNECDSRHVPVIVLLTKADTLNLDAVQKLMKRGATVEDAVREAPEVEKQLQKSCLEKVKGWLNGLKFPPQSYLVLTGMQQESAGCGELLKCTANALTEEGLQGLLISSQQSNLGLCMEFAITKTLKKIMNNGARQIQPDGVARALATWFPYRLHQHRRGEYHDYDDYELGLGFHNQYFHYGRGFDYDEQYYDGMDDNLVQPIIHESFSISIPMLSTSRQPCLKALVEHGIGCVMVFENLFFQIQFKDGSTASKDLQQDLTMAVQEYQTSGVQDIINTSIAEAFQKHGESVNDLCPMLVDIALENQMSKNILK